MPRIIYTTAIMMAFLMTIDDAVKGSDWTSMIFKLLASLKVREN